MQNGRVKEKKSQQRNEENFEGSIGGLCSSWALSEWKNALTKLCLPVFTYATLQQANWISHSRVMLHYSRFLFLTIQVYWYAIRGKRIAKMWLLIAAIQFFRHVYGLIRVWKLQCCLGSGHQWTLLLWGIRTLRTVPGKRWWLIWASSLPSCHCFSNSLGRHKCCR